MKIALTIVVVPLASQESNDSIDRRTMRPIECVERVTKKIVDFVIKLFAKITS